MISNYRKKQILSRFKWEDITQWIKWDDDDRVGTVNRYCLVIKEKGKLMTLHPLVVTCGNGAFAPFPEGTYWLTARKGKRSLLFSSVGISELRKYGVHGC